MAIDSTDKNQSSHLETVRAHKEFQGRSRYDYVKFADGNYGRVLLFFKVELLATGSNFEELCLVRLLSCVDCEHVSGHQVLKPYVGPRGNDLSVIPVESIMNVVHVVPNFKTVIEDSRDYNKK